MIHSAPVDHGQVALGLVAGLLEARTGQTLTADRAWRVGTSLTGVLRRHGLETLDQLGEKLAREDDPVLAEHVVEALLNNETYFFRDRMQFDNLAMRILPALHERRLETRKLWIWSVGCSTGQEAYSLAMLFAEQPARWHGWTIDILATDVAPSVVTTARAALYNQFQIQRGLGAVQMLSFFEETQAGWRAQEWLRRMVRFQTHNVLDPAPQPARFDLILCRNVLLYFNRDTRVRAFERLAEALAPDGRLMLGGGETTVGQTRALTPVSGEAGFHGHPDASAGRRRAA